MGSRSSLADETTETTETMSETSATLLAAVESALGSSVIAHAETFGDLVVRVQVDAWRAAAEVAKGDLHCDYLSFLAGIDWLPAPPTGDAVGGDTSSPAQPQEMTFGVAGSEGRFQLIASVASTARHHRIIFKTDLDEANPQAPTWVPVYPGADWHERECWEMFGVGFPDHPHVRHLYLPAEFEGHPLRKDFPLLAREVKPWPGLVDVELMPGEPAEGGEGDASTAEAGSGDGE